MSAILSYAKQFIGSSVGQALVVYLVVFYVHTALETHELNHTIAMMLPPALLDHYEPAKTAAVAALLWLVVSTFVYRKPITGFLPQVIKQPIASYIPDFEGNANVGATVQAMQKAPLMRGSLSVGDTFDA